MEFTPLGFAKIDSKYEGDLLCILVIYLIVKNFLKYSIWGFQSLDPLEFFLKSHPLFTLSLGLLLTPYPLFE
jgi:hypothetical protein